MNKTEQVIQAVQELKLLQAYQKQLYKLEDFEFSFGKEAPDYHHIITRNWGMCFRMETTNPLAAEYLLGLTRRLNDVCQREMHSILAQHQRIVDEKLAFISGAVNEQPEPAMSEFDAILKSNCDPDSICDRISAYGADRFFTELAEKNPDILGDMATFYYKNKIETP
jgi:hypothetical protein